jgi:hypothetical protein
MTSEGHTVLTIISRRKKSLLVTFGATAEQWVRREKNSPAAVPVSFAEPRNHLRAN